jgi:hypothetical protein
MTATGDVWSEHQQANEYCRAVALSALALLAAWAEVPRDGVVDYFLWLAEEGLEREPSQVWNSLASESADIEARPMFSALRRAYDEGLIEPEYIQLYDLDDAESAPPGSLLERTRERRPPIDDVARAISWWARFWNERARRQLESSSRATKVERNEPCPCGSGKKYKKCCGA